MSIIPEVILDGDISPAHGNRLRIEHKGHLVLLTKSGKQKEATKWLFHAYKLWPKK